MIVIIYFLFAFNDDHTERIQGLEEKVQHLQATVVTQNAAHEYTTV